MSYIIVRSTIHPEMEQAFKGTTTYIEYEEETLDLQATMSSLLAARVITTGSPFCLYKTTQPPYVVLNRLMSRVGYKVVTANSIGDDEYHGQLWTLCNF